MTKPIQGDVAPGLEAIADAFAEALADRPPTSGAALSIFRQGQPIVSLWGGVADERTGEAWREDTPSVIFSCTKGLVSILAARLVEEGRLDYEAPVARYWPEFAAAGKSEVKVRHLLSHQAGLSAPDVDMTLDDIIDWPTVTGMLARQAPIWPPGSGYAYHAITHGWLAGEVIRRVTGRSVGQYFAELIAEPLAVPAWIGLPAAHRDPVAHLQTSPELLSLWNETTSLDTPEARNWPYRAMTLGQALPVSLVTPDGGFNDPHVRAAEIPGAGGIASAAALASIWSATVTPTKGVSLLSRDIVAQATAVQTEGAPVFPATEPFPRWGMGFQLDSAARRYLSQSSFGHDGAGGQVGFADAEAELGFAFVTNWMEGPSDQRATRIIDALRSAL